MKLALVSDAWHPQINGVVRTLDRLCGELAGLGHEVAMLTPQGRPSVPCPSYPEIRLALATRRAVDEFLDRAAPDAVHIATEGPLGIAVRRRCLARGIAFTTAWHTRFPDYLALRTGLPEAWFYPLMRRFHAPSSAVMVATRGLMEELAARGFDNLRRWSRGVDTELFRPATDRPPRARPVALFVGRVAVEKNIAAFLDLDLPVDKLVVGDGPALDSLRRRHRDATFLGAQSGEVLAQLYRDADVFVFPSRTDTFGLVMLEALASGVPVAGFPVPGPLDVIGREGRGTVEGFDRAVGCLDEDLGRAIEGALACRAEDCRAYAGHFSWRACADQFLDNLAPIETARRAA